MDHRIKSIWRPLRIEVEGSQHLQFIENKPPVPNIVLGGVKRIPSCKFGICKIGMAVTRQIAHGENCTVLSFPKKPPWTVQNHSNRFEVMKRVAQLLHLIHEKNFIHGDYMLKNIVFAPEKPAGKYWIIDLGSVWFLSSHQSLSPFDRMVYSFAQCGFSRNDALHFLESYLCCSKDKNPAPDPAKKHLEMCSNPKDHRALKASRLFALNGSPSPDV